MRSGYLAEGKLFLVGDDGVARAVVSHFAKEVAERQRRDQQRHAWKRGSAGWNTNAAAAMGAAGLMGALGDSGGGEQVAQFTGLAPIGEGKWLYAIRLGQMGGLFEYDEKSKSERRLVHRQGLCVTHVSGANAKGEHVVSLWHPNGTACLGTCEAEGRRLKEITEGDCVDECPAWESEGSSAIVYQSAGVGRNAHGIMVGLGPYAVQRLDLISGEMETLWEDDRFDFLSPRAGKGGELYCIRRPYEPVKRASHFSVLKDAVLFPFRMAMAVVAFANVFSLIFTKKPLITAGTGPGGADKRQEGADARWVMLHRRVVEVKAEGEGKEPGAMVGKEWELVRRDGAGNVDVIARGVVSFDVGADGSVVWTDGVQVVCRGADGVEKPVVEKGRFVELVRMG